MVDDHPKTAIDRLIREFSTFFILDSFNSASLIAVSKQDARLKRLMEKLASDRLQVSADAWARYFLLVSQQISLHSPNLLIVLSVPDRSTQVLQVIRDLVQVAPLYNVEVQTIHSTLCDRYTQLAPTSSGQEGMINVEKLLGAYLQKIGWYAAKHIFYTRVEAGNLKQQYSFEDCLSIADLKTSEPTQLLRRFDFRRSNQVKTYAEQRLRGAIADTIRAQDVGERSKRQSPDGLLRSLTKWELKESLMVQGFPDHLVLQHHLVWQCYQEIYHPKQNGRQSLPPPTPEELQQMSDRFNQRRQKLGAATDLTPKQVQANLATIEQAVRAYRDRTAINKRIYENAPDTQPSSLDSLIQQEEREQIRTVLVDAFAQLSEPNQIALHLTCGLNFNQTDVLKLLGKDLGANAQYQICRLLAKAKKQLLLTFAQQWQHYDPDVFRDDLGQVLPGMQAVLDEWLEQYCRMQFDPPLLNWWNTRTPDERSLLDLHCIYGLTTSDIANQYQMPLSDLDAQMTRLMRSIQETLQQWVETTMRLDLSLCSSVDQKLEHFIETWLGDRPTPNS